MFGLCPDCYRICGANLAAMLSVKLWENPWNIDVSHPKASWLGPKSYDFTLQLAVMFIEGPDLINQTAFREVADGLAARGTYDDEVASVERYTEAQQSALDLSEMRFRNGVDNYLAVLAAQTGLYSAQQTLVSARLSRLTNLVDLYRSLGGGWIERTGGTPRPAEAIGSIAPSSSAPRDLSASGERERPAGANLR